MMVMMTMMRDDDDDDENFSVLWICVFAGALILWGWGQDRFISMKWRDNDFDVTLKFLLVVCICAYGVVV